jgi:serine/threonine protein kinase
VSSGCVPGWVPAAWGGSTSPWLATAYVPGPTLQQLVDERGPLPEAALWRLAGGLAEALHAVHAAGLVHRDLKPNNVLVAEDGPRVIDFGVSRALDATSVPDPGRRSGPRRSCHRSRQEAGDVGAASDVFSLGAVLCFAATGWPPFGDANMLTVLYRSAIMTRNAGTGVAGWRHDWSGNSAVGAALALGPGTLLAGTGQTLCSFSVATGDAQWQLPLDGGVLAIQVADDVAYVSTSLASATDNDSGGWVYAVQL